jgi:hypothetical protein
MRAVALAVFDEAAFLRAAVILVPDVNEAAVNGADFKKRRLLGSTIRP